jgi:3-keto-disaccharide hydrolase
MSCACGCGGNKSVLLSSIVAASFVILMGFAQTERQELKPPAGFLALFNGENLDGWWGAGTEDPRGWMALSEEDFAAKKEASLADIREHWSVEDGELVNDGHGLYLTTEKNYGDFELRLDYKTVAQADSGIYLRGVPQVQIWDTTEAGGKWGIGADKGSGGLWNNSGGAAGKDPLVHADKPFGEWNQVRLVMLGERVTVWLNGELVVDHARLENYFDRSLPVPRVGPIQLQTHGGEIRWRDVFLREIGGEEANALLRQGGPARTKLGRPGFESVFNGKDLTGWLGATGSYEVTDGAIQCMPGHGGTLFTEASFSDFVAQLDIRIPPGGNNGLAIRYPGEGDTAYVGMCELQVLDNTDPRNAELDPRQYHGSMYAQAAAHRGYLRPAGQWNYQEVTANGSQLTVELNGTVILDVDTAAITEFMYDAKYFAGRTRTEGHFGFAGHGDPVAFRGIGVKRLEGE